MTREKHENTTGRHRGSVLLVALTTAVMATLLLAAGAGTASAAHQIDSCADDVNNPGLHVINDTITNDTVSSCIDVNVGDVILDGQDNTVNGVDNDTDSIGIDVDGAGTLTNVTVRNVNLTGWGDEFGRGAAIEVSETDASGGVNIISDVNITRTGGAIKISPDDNPTTGVNVTNSVVSGTGANANAVSLGDTPQVNITNNVFRNSGAAILRIGVSGNLTFADNTFGPSNAEGIVLFPASDDEVTFRNDTFVDISGPDIDDRQPVGPSGTNVTFRNTTSGINATVDFDAEGIATIDAPSAVPSDPANDRNVNEYLNVTNDGFTSPTYLNVTFDYDPANIPADARESTLEVQKYNGTWNEEFGVTFRDLDTTAQEVTVNTTEVGSVFAPLANTTIDPDEISQCRTINASNAPSDGLVELTGDIMDSSAPSCINVTVSDVTLDGQDFTVDSDTTGGTAINVTNATQSLSNVTVRNVNVTEWTEEGILYDDAGDGLITGVNVTSPAAGAYDHIVVNDSDGTDVTDSKASGDPLQGGNGVVLAYTDGSTVRDNAFRSNDNRGLRLRFSNDTLIEGNKLINNNNGLRTESRSSNATIRDNNASLNDVNGIGVAGGPGHDVINNTLIGNNAAGIETSLGSTGNNITENKVVSMSTTSIGIEIKTANNVVTSNVVRGSDDEGIRVGQLASGGNVVRDNFLVANDVGLRIESAGTVVNNTVRNNAFAAFQTRNGDRVSVENLDIGMSTAANTTLDFEARNVGVRTNASPPSNPANEANIGRFIEATNNSVSHFLNVTFEYNDSDVASVDEPALDVWKYNSSDAWTELGTGPATDIGANEIQFNVTNVGSVFAPLAGQGAVGGAPGAGGECINRRNIGRGQEDQECPRDRGLGRGESREDLDRATGRNSDTARRDRGRGEGRGRGR
jgi:parallel beta-helix repeat protein